MKGIRPYMLGLLGVLLIGCRPIYVQLECPHTDIPPAFKYVRSEYWKGYEVISAPVTLRDIHPKIYFDSIKVK